MSPLYHRLVRSAFIVLSAWILLMATGLAQSIATNYTFSQSVGTYTPITGGTVLARIDPANTSGFQDDEAFNNIPIGFNFNFNGTVYTNVSISTNGYLVFGATLNYGYSNPIAAGADPNVVSALFLDLWAKTGSEMSYKLEGSAGSQVFTVQWTAFRNYSSTASATLGDDFNFQIKLYENALNSIEIRYGTITNASNWTIINPPPTTVQLHPAVGLRAVSTSDFSVRKASSGVNTWAASIVGTTNTDVCELTSTFNPPSGLVYKWDLTTVPPPPSIPNFITISGGTYGISYPVYNYWYSSKSETVYPQQEFLNAGWGGGPGLITQVGWEVVNVGNPASTFSNGMVYIYLMNTSLTSLVSGAETPDATMTLVWSGPQPVFSPFGWKYFTLSTPFMYDGTNLLVKVVHDGNAWTSAYPYFRATDKGTATYYHRTAANDVPATSLTTLSVYQYRPDIRFDMCLDANPPTVDGSVPSVLNKPAMLPITYSILDPNDSYSCPVQVNLYTPTNVPVPGGPSFNINVVANTPITGTMSIPSNSLAPGYYIVELVFNTKDACTGTKQRKVRQVVMVLEPGQVPCMVWPGDVDNSGLVNYADRKALNQYVQDANLRSTWLLGPARFRVDYPANLAAYMNWEAQPSVPWQTADGCYMDCDGNGMVNNLDYLVMKINWMKMHGTPKDSPEALAPLGFDLGQNYPNPFRPVTALTYATPEPSVVRLTVTDMLGRTVATVVDSRVEAGRFKAMFDATQLPAGMYFATMTANGLESGVTFAKSIRMTVSGK